MAEMLHPSNRELLVLESKRRLKRGSDGSSEFARAVLALEALEAVAPQMKYPFQMPRGADEAAGGLQIVPVRLRAPGELARIRARAADGADPDVPIYRPGRAAAVPWWKQRLHDVGRYLKARQGWFTIALTVLFPKVLVAIMCRTVKAVTTQVFLELGGWGMETFTTIANVTADKLDQIEELIINTTQAAVPQLAGAAIITFIAMTAGTQAQFLALPP